MYDYKAAAAAIETRSIKLEFKAFDEAKGIFTGYASVFGNEDQGGDIVKKGAFKRTLAESGPRGVKMLYEHNHHEPIGFWTDLVEDDHGLLATGRLLIEDLPKARECHALMKAGVLDGLSIGYRCQKASHHHQTPHVRVLEDVTLKEISAVMFPMNTSSVISDVKSGELPTEREFERWATQDAGLHLSRSDVRQFLLPAYRNLLQAKQDAGAGVASKSHAGDAALAVELRRLTEALTR